MPGGSSVRLFWPKSLKGNTIWKQSTTQSSSLACFIAHSSRHENILLRKPKKKKQYSSDKAAKFSKAPSGSPVSSFPDKYLQVIQPIETTVTTFAFQTASGGQKTTVYRRCSINKAGGEKKDSGWQVWLHLVVFFKRNVTLFFLHNFGSYLYQSLSTRERLLLQRLNYSTIKTQKLTMEYFQSHLFLTTNPMIG